MADKKINNIINDEDFFFLSKAVLEYAEKEGVDLSNKNLIIETNEEGIIFSEKAEDVAIYIKIITDIKNELFSDVDISKLSDEEYEKKLTVFDNKVRINMPGISLKNVKNKYPNIDFDNLDSSIPDYIETGDFLYESMYKEFGDDGDYSPIIIEWCRAVELELRNKIYKCINNKNIKIDIGNKSMESRFYIEGCKQSRNFKKLVVNNMMGFYSALKNFEMIEYVFNNYIKQVYPSFELNEFKSMIDYIIVVNDYRDNSAHSITKIKLNKSTADDCKQYIVASQKILETLSHLSKSKK